MIGLSTQPLSADHRYHAAFDAVSALPADLVLIEYRHPGAAAALKTWALAHNKALGSRDAVGWHGVLYVTLGHGADARSIDVYLT